MEELKPVAREALETFQSIDREAASLLQKRGLNLGALAVVNQATAEAIAANMHQRNLDRTSNLHELRRKPAIARLVIADQDDQQETLYIAPNAEVSIPGMKLCSYLNNAGKGKLASFNPGDGTNMFLSGDFNQRLTVQGTRSEDDLDWSVPGGDVHQIAVSYRQSRKLAAYARALARKQGATIDDRAPDYGENIGFDPVCGVGLDTDEKRAEWLARRIREIEAIGNGTLPTVAVLVSDKDAVDALTEHLDRQLAKTNLRARAYSAGNAIGHSQDVRVFSIEHIKGLEFEAVFFADVDRLAEAQPELFDRYIYVGATRAATFLGLTCSGPTLPTALIGSDLSYGQNW